MSMTEKWILRRKMYYCKKLDTPIYSWQCNPLWDIVETIQIDRCSWSRFLLIVVNVYWNLLDRCDRKAERNRSFEMAVENHPTYIVDKPIVIWKLVTVERESQMLIHLWNRLLKLFYRANITMFILRVQLVYF